MIIITLVSFGLMWCNNRRVELLGEIFHNLQWLSVKRLQSFGADKVTVQIQCLHFSDDCMCESRGIVMTAIRINQQQGKIHRKIGLLFTPLNCRPQ